MWEQGNIEQFWKGTRTPLGDPHIRIQSKPILPCLISSSLKTVSQRNDTLNLEGIEFHHRFWEDMISEFDRTKSGFRSLSDGLRIFTKIIRRLDDHELHKGSVNEASHSTDTKT